VFNFKVILIKSVRFRPGFNGLLVECNQFLSLDRNSAQNSNERADFEKFKNWILDIIFKWMVFVYQGAYIYLCLVLLNSKTNRLIWASRKSRIFNVVSVAKQRKVSFSMFVSHIDFNYNLIPVKRRLGSSVYTAI